MTASSTANSNRNKRKSKKKIKRSKAKPPPMLFEWASQPSPYYQPIHHRWRKHVRSFVKKEVLPNIDQWEREMDVPNAFYELAYNAGIYSTFYPKEMGGTPFEDYVIVSEKKVDPFFSIIMNEEICRAGSAGLIGAMYIHYICVAPILLFGSEYLKNKVQPVIRAQEFASLAISETAAGSDVRNITTTATLTADGKHYIVNGAKYWITGGMKSKYFTTAVRTGKPGMFGISLLLIERGEGMITNRLSLQGHDTSATALVIFNNMKVPAENIIGEVNQGFRQIMYNFNTERFGIVTTAIALAKTCTEEAAEYAQTRETFGKKLIGHQVIRHKIMEMTRKVLSAHCFMEWCAYRQSRLIPGTIDRSLVKDISLLKVEATRCLEYCAREAAQVFGGRAYVKGGRAAKVERIYRDVRAMAIYGGSEEIMLDLAGRQAKL